MSQFDGYPNLLNPECPWTPVRVATGLPNVKWCEETLCGWVSEPANTWTNLAYLVVAAVLFVVTRRDAEKTLRFWAPAAVLVGLTSLVYHASVTFVLQVLDFWGMYFYFGLVLALNLIRLGVLDKTKLFRVLWPAIAALTALTVVVAKIGLPVQGIIVVLLVATLVTEVAAFRRRSVPASAAYIVLTLAVFAIAATFSASDASRAWCEPENHVLLQGHALWHVFSAAALGISHFHYRQFRAQYV
ncbi:MAG: ceramidase domain-containing protein [Archangium sp.]|nr:ceramidase domain-containing protein [Archangium sp.]